MQLLLRFTVLFSQKEQQYQCNVFLSDMKGKKFKENYVEKVVFFNKKIAQFSQNVTVNAQPFQCLIPKCFGEKDYQLKIFWRKAVLNKPFLYSFHFKNQKHIATQHLELHLASDN